MPPTHVLSMYNRSFRVFFAGLWIDISPPHRSPEMPAQRPTFPPKNCPHTCSHFTGYASRTLSPPEHPTNGEPIRGVLRRLRRSHLTTVVGFRSQASCVIATIEG